MSKGTFLWNKRKKDLTCYLRILSDFRLRFGHNFQQSCRNCTIFAKGAFWGKTVVLKKNPVLFPDCEWNIFGWTFEKSSDVSRGNFPRKDFPFQKIMSFSCLCRCFFPDKWWKSFGKVFRTAFQLSRWAYFLKKTAFGKSWFFFKFGSRTNLVWKFCGNFSQVQRKLQSKCPQKQFEEIMFLFWPKPLFSHLRTLTAAFLNFRRKLFCQFCQYGIQRIQRNDWVKLLSYKKLELFYHFWTLIENSLEILPKNFVTVVENVLGCPGYV